VNKNTVKFVLPRFGPVSRLIEEFVKVNLEREFEAIVDLCGGVRILSTVHDG
jgi:hypothetical protein